MQMTTTALIFRIFMSIVTFLNGAASLLLLAVPPIPAAEVLKNIATTN